MFTSAFLATLTGVGVTAAGLSIPSAKPLWPMGRKSPNRAHASAGEKVVPAATPEPPLTFSAPQPLTHELLDDGTLAPIEREQPEPPADLVAYLGTEMVLSQLHREGPCTSGALARSLSMGEDAVLAILENALAKGEVIYDGQWWPAGGRHA